MTIPWLEISWTPALVTISLLGLLVGAAVHLWAVWLTGDIPSRNPLRNQLGSAIICAGLFVLIAWGLFIWNCQVTPEVTPSAEGRFWRLVFQLTLVSLLWGTVVTDLRDYVIPDAIVVTGLTVGLLGQFTSGELQIQHLWIDWNAEVPGIEGPAFPHWIDRYRRVHGLAVGAMGAVVGAGVTWLVRAVSSRLIGQETMGFGDVTLMAMIGSYLGWQPVLFVFLLAPVCGIAVSLVTRFVGGKHYLPYGPFLAMATVIVLLSWKWIWLPLRYVFGHVPTLMGLIGGAAGAFVLLLILARLYRMIPVDQQQRYSASPTRDQETDAWLDGE